MRPCFSKQLSHLFCPAFYVKRIFHRLYAYVVFHIFCTFCAFSSLVFTIQIILTNQIFLSAWYSRPERKIYPCRLRELFQTDGEQSGKNRIRQFLTSAPLYWEEQRADNYGWVFPIRRELNLRPELSLVLLSWVGERLFPRLTIDASCCWLPWAPEVKRKEENGIRDGIKGKKEERGERNTLFSWTSHPSCPSGQDVRLSLFSRQSVAFVMSICQDHLLISSTTDSLTLHSGCHIIVIRKRWTGL